MSEFLRFQSNVFVPIALETLQGVANDGVYGPQKLFPARRRSAAQAECKRAAGMNQLPEPELTHEFF